MDQSDKTHNGNLTKKIIHFSRFLRGHGFKAFSSNVSDALCCLDQIDVGSRMDFFNTLRANLVSNEMEWQLFNDLFDKYWQQAADDGSTEEFEPPWSSDLDGDGGENEPPDTSPLTQIEEAKSALDDNEKEFIEATCYSPVTVLQNRDIGQFCQTDIQFAQLILKNLISPFKLTAMRRFKKSKKTSDIDFRQMLRESLKTEGIPFEISYRKKKKRLKKLVVLADVSGSMERYARFIMPFILGLKGVGVKAEVFVFSTSLFPITRILKGFDLDRALSIISKEFPEWSGGTRIGHSLHQFNQDYGERLIHHRTVVVILSDGWDLGGTAILEREMKTLRRRAHTIMWLNPLAGDADYQPLCKGMKTALPYLDQFLPAHNLESLKRIGHKLTRAIL